MLANKHYMLDAYGCSVEQTNSIMAVNSLIVHITDALNMKPVMPPFLVPYYYCEDTEDVGVSAFCICAGGSHVTIHTFPYRSCYFVDILTNSYFEEEYVTDIICSRLYAKNKHVNTVDRRVFDESGENIDFNYDFGPHYMLTVTDIDVSFEQMFKWLDNVAPKINMTPITRPYVIYDKANDPDCISGVLVVAQSHIAFHYSIKQRIANIDIFSCSFLDNGVVEYIIKQSFGDDLQLNLIARGSKHHIECQQYSRDVRNSMRKSWQSNI